MATSRNLVTIATLVTLMTLVQGTSYRCSELLSNQEGVRGEWNTDVNVPLTSELGKFSDHWAMTMVFTGPVSDFQVNSVALSTESSSGNRNSQTVSFATNSLPGKTLIRKLDSRTVELRQNVYIERQTFHTGHVTLSVNIGVAFQGYNLGLDKLIFNNVQVC